MTLRWWSGRHLPCGPASKRPGCCRPRARFRRKFLDRQAGFLRRELLRGTQGQWFDLVYWASRSAAEEAIRNAASNHAEPGAGVLQLDRVAVFGS